jgi:histidyl-tRNA synthetase
LVLDKSVGKALEYANAKGVGKVVFVGKEEVAKGKFKVRDMVNGKEEFLSEDKVLGLFG